MRFTIRKIYGVYKCRVYKINYDNGNHDKYDYILDNILAKLICIVFVNLVEKRTLNVHF